MPGLQQKIMIAMKPNPKDLLRAMFPPFPVASKRSPVRRGSATFNRIEGPFDFAGTNSLGRRTIKTTGVMVDRVLEMFLRDSAPDRLQMSPLAPCAHLNPGRDHSYTKQGKKSQGDGLRGSGLPGFLGRDFREPESVSGIVHKEKMDRRERRVRQVGLATVQFFRSGRESCIRYCPRSGARHLSFHERNFPEETLFRPR